MKLVKFWQESPRNGERAPIWINPTFVHSVVDGPEKNQAIITLPDGAYEIVHGSAETVAGIIEHNLA